MSELDVLVDRFGYPLYIYDENILSERAGMLKEAFEGFSLYYSLKANPNPRIVRSLARKGFGADCASAREVMIASECGIRNGDVLYSSPGKTESDIAAASGRSVIVADSFGELELLERFFLRRTDIGVRINPAEGFSKEKAFETMGGTAGKFGIDEEAFFSELPLIRRYKKINITGIHVYMGSGILDEDVIIGNFEIILKIASRFDTGLDFIDFGGGFGIPYEEGSRELDLKKLKAGISGLLQRYDTGRAKLIIESGRFVAGPCGKYLTKITDIKVSRGKKYYIIHGGMNGFFRPVFTGTKHRVTVHSGSPGKELVTVAGHLCTPIDVTAEDIITAKAEVGDILEISDAGAYGFTMSLKEFISHEKPKEIYIKGNGKAIKC